MTKARNRRKKPENRRCRIDPTHRGPISGRELCVECGIERQTFAARQLNAKSGPIYDAWLEACLKRLQGLQDSSR